MAEPRIYVENTDPSLNIEELIYRIEISQSPGAEGPQGDKGDTGDTGAVGPEGPAAPIGTYHNYGNSGAAFEIDTQAYTSQRLVISEACVITVANWAAVGSFELLLENGGNFAVTWFAMDITGGLDGDGFNLTTDGVDTFVFSTKNTGGKVKGYQTGINIES